MAGRPISQSPIVKELQRKLALAFQRIEMLEQGGVVVPPAPDIYNTLAGSEMPAYQVDGFVALANIIDNRLAALGY